MNYGRLTEHIYERSVTKTIKNSSVRNSKFYDGAGLGADCAIMPYTGNEALVSGQASAFGRDDNVAVRALIAAANNVTAKSEVLDAYAVLNLTVPAGYREIKVRRIMEQAAFGAEMLCTPVLSADVSVLPYVSEPIVKCMVSGRLGKYKRRFAEADEDIVMTKWLGLEGTAVIAGKSFDALSSRYPDDIVSEAHSFTKYLSTAPEAATAVKSDAGSMCVVREGGIFGALWSLAADNGVGLVADLKSIPVRQETIEVCEFFDLNPYELLAGGSLLITTKNGNELVERLQEQNIPAAVIGKICEGNDRIIRHGEETRFLEPAKGDEIFRYFEIIGGKNERENFNNT